MAKKNKTTETQVSVAEFVNTSVQDEQKRNDSFRLIELMRQWSGFEPKMWGPSIIGFGSYHYRYESRHEGDAPILGFSPRKTEFSLYVFSAIAESEALLGRLGKMRMGKACIYVKKLSDIDIAILEKLCRITVDYINEHHECACHDGSSPANK